MMDNKDTLLYLHYFDGINMFDLEQIIKLYLVSEVLRSEMCRRLVKQNLTYYEDAVLDLIDFTVEITDMVVLKKPGVLQEFEELYDGVLLYDRDVGHAHSSLIEYDD